MFCSLASTFLNLLKWLSQKPANMSRLLNIMALLQYSFLLAIFIPVHIPEASDPCWPSSFLKPRLTFHCSFRSVPVSQTTPFISFILFFLLQFPEHKMFPKELPLTFSFLPLGAHPLPQFQQYHYGDNSQTFISSSDLSSDLLFKQRAGNLPLNVLRHMKLSRFKTKLLSFPNKSHASSCFMFF